MSDNVRSMVFGPSVLYLVAIAAVGLSFSRRPRTGCTTELLAIVRLLLVGIAFQCLHFTEEFVTGFYIKAPQFLGLVRWSSEFFVVFNLIWIALWVSSAAGVMKGHRVAYFPVWFFAVGMVGNAIWHPLLCLATGGYFPGLYTSPFAGAIGVVLLRKLWKHTSSDEGID